MTTFVKNQIDPTAIFVQKPEKGDALEIKQIRVEIAAGAGPSNIVAAVTGKKIRLLSLQVHAVTATVAFSLESNGTYSFDGFAVFNDNNGNYWKNFEVGIVESDTGQALRAAVGGGSACRFAGRYIEVTP